MPKAHPCHFPFAVAYILSSKHWQLRLSGRVLRKTGKGKLQAHDQGFLPAKGTTLRPAGGSNPKQCLPFPLHLLWG